MNRLFFLSYCIILFSCKTTENKSIVKLRIVDSNKSYTETGDCLVKVADSIVVLDPNTFNEVANVIVKGYKTGEWITRGYVPPLRDSIGDVLNIKKYFLKDSIECKGSYRTILGKN